MNIIVADDEKLALEGMMSTVIKAVPEARVHGYRQAEAVLEASRNMPEPVDVAFLDIEMRGISGMELARKLMDIFPDINIVFVTGYSEYSLEALQIHASGYVMKPVTVEKIRKELEVLRHPVSTRVDQGSKGLHIRTFGNFEVLIDNAPAVFKYQKTKELFAYLIDRRGSMCSNSEIISVLWEDDDDGKMHISYLKNIRTDLLNVLASCKMEDCVVRSRGEIGVRCDMISCDYFNFLDGKPGTEPFRGEYMTQYSWAEYTLASLLQLSEKGHN